MSTITGTFDSATQLLVPALQAAATILILEKQKDFHDDIANDRKATIQRAVDRYLTDTNALLATGIFREAYGSVPIAAEYVPVDALQEQYEVINSNLQNVKASERLTVAINRLQEQDGIARMVVFCPAFLHNMHAQSMQIRDLMAGKVTVDDAIDVLTDTAEQSAMNGRVGNTNNVTNRAFGLRRMQMQAAGRAAMAQEIGMVQAVNPIQGAMTLKDMVETPAQRIALSLAQNQLIQQSLQNYNNADAAGDPTQFAELQVKLNALNVKVGNEAQQANLVNQFVPDFATILTPQIKSITEGLLGSKQDASFNSSLTNPSSAGDISPL